MAVLLREEIAIQGKALSPVGRAYLIDILETSLEEDGFVDSGVDAAWESEVQRRLNAYDRGESQAVELTEATTEMRRRLNVPRDDQVR